MHRSATQKGKVIPLHMEKALRPVSLVKIPLLSSVPAGKTAAMFHPEHTERYITVDNVKDPTAFALIVRGDSMSPKIENGDIVVVGPQQEPRSGDICVVRVREEDVLKKVKFDGDRLHLIPLNQEFQKVTVSMHDVLFIWKVVRVIKNL